ncbi:Cellulase (glycosyl hydrolase family 5 protein) [Rhizoctonia solani]|uniref:mannan endo-1,4-beta-mannosidase n=1 Tax=Rhizoctonia solani TaxID=456999 RepID=A0A8H8P083_9AGAM|nr:Cellulase (glycosyl hydrolase family 5 protein) [Rhizoctonia solani]QRW21488.1 Cellulase (glycosyl hydrolase family 5 protein) [Rhizoctonia solani]
MKYALTTATLAATIGTVVAVAEWGQCGGINYSGPTTCDAGLSCVKQNEYYSQCLKATTTTGPTTTSRPITTTTTAPVTSTTSTTPPPASTGYVKVSGQKFTLNGATFTVVGSNAYWIPQLSNPADITTAFSDLKKAGFTALRTWGFNEVTSPSGTYYQLWNGATSTINTGADGLARFDQVVAGAKAAGIRLIVALTNNWSDYGGMDVYVKQILGSNNHDLFYTDATVKAAFKKYIDAFVGRYKNEPTIMACPAAEEAVEPRLELAHLRQVSNTITAWAKEFSAYIKSIAPNQLVGLGDEGFFNRPGHPSYPYQGGEGIDFDANLQISTLDFGTAHAYPEHWGEANNITLWGVQWIRDHAASQKAANKPVILEEFGVTEQYGRLNIYPVWWKEIISSGLAGDLIWQAGSALSYGNAHDDGYTIFPGEAEYTLQTQYAAELKARG